jgi:hypothetical protein
VRAGGTESRSRRRFGHLMGTAGEPVSIGAPRFELGTSSPPDFSARWPELRRSVARWLRCAVLALAYGRLPHGSVTSFSDVWAMFGATGTVRTHA